MTTAWESYKKRKVRAAIVRWIMLISFVFGTATGFLSLMILRRWF